MPWSTAWSTYGTSSDEGLRREAGLHVPGRHPGPLQEPARPGAPGRRRRGAPRQPDVRRRDHAAGEVRRHHDQRRLVRGPGLLHQPGLGLRAERAPGRQGPGRGTAHPGDLPGADAVQGKDRTRRRDGGHPGGRRGVRRCLQVPGPGQVRPPELDGVEGRDGPGAGRRRRKDYGMSETVEMKPASEEELREALMDVVDPELGIDVVNLGLIYGIHIDDSNVATIDMTLTSAACPLTDVIEDQAKSATDGLVDRKST